MALTRVTLIDKIEVLPETGHILVRRATRIVEDAEVLATTFHRESFAPGDDLSQQPPKVRAIAVAAWLDGRAGFDE